MMKRWGIEFTAIVLSAGVASAEQAIPSFAVRTDLVLLSATVVDRKGRPVHDLGRNELQLFEEGRQQPIAHFTQANDVEAKVLVLVDISGSMDAEQYRARTMMAAREILANLGPEDKVGLSAFDREYWPLLAFSTERAPIMTRLERLHPWGSTALHDALARGASQLAEQAEGRRAIVVLTDGVDTASQLDIEQVIAQSRALDVPIYAVAVVSPVDDPKSSLFTGRDQPTQASAAGPMLRRYAALSGGRAFTVSDLRGLRRAAAAIGGELDNQYRVGYRPPDGPGGYRRVEVRSTRKGVVVRTRGGYVSEP